MNIDSIYFKGYSCFKKKWAGFDTIKPINVIIGRNNSGKSHLLNLVESLYDARLSHHEWQTQCHGVLDEESLKKVFPERRRDTSQNLNAALVFSDVQPLVGEKLIWEVAPSRSESPPHGYGLQVSSLRFPAFSSEQSSNIPLAVEEMLKSATHQFSYSPEQSGNIPSGIHNMLRDTTHQFRTASFCRLLADRDIETELEDIEMELGRDGQGATNIIRRLILTSDERFSREVIQEELLAALNLIFGRALVHELVFFSVDRLNKNRLLSRLSTTFAKKPMLSRPRNLSWPTYRLAPLPSSLVARLAVAPTSCTGYVIGPTMRPGCNSAVV